MSPPRSRLPRFLDALLLAALGTALTIWTWGQWFHLIIDYGRELYVPWRLTEGEVLYRDIAYFNGPLSAYWNAFLFDVFGVGIRTQTIANLVVVALVTWLVYSVVRELAGRLLAVLGGATYLFAFAFQYQEAGNFNWIAPYSHEITHGVALAFAAIWLARVHLSQRRLRELAFLGLALGFCALTKPEVWLAATAGVATALAAGWSVERPGSRVVVRRVSLLTAATLAPPLMALGLLTRTLGFAGALRAVTGGWNYMFDPALRELLFYKKGLGTDAVATNLGVALAWLACGALVMCAVAAVAFLRGEERRRSLAIRLLTVCGGGAIAVAFLVPWGELKVLRAFSPLTLTSSALLGLLARKWWQRRGDAQRGSQAAWRVGFAVFACLLLAKMLLNARVHHYGFALALPATLLTMVAVVHWLPRWLSSHGASESVARNGAIALMLAVAGFMTYRANRILNDPPPIGRVPPAPKNLQVAGGVDAFFAERNIQTRAFLDLQRWLRTSTKPDATLVALPEGVMCNYLARRRNPTRHINFMPPELVMFGEREILEALQRDPPDYVVVFQRATGEYGLPLFGKDYGQALYEWVRETYTKVVWGAGPPPLENAIVGGVRVFSQ